MILPDGRALGDPSNAEIAEAAGAPTDFDERDFDLVIVGAGPAGLSAAVYGASEGLRTLVVDEGGIGGQVRSSPLIRNYLGFPRGVSGNRLAEQAHEQASVFGASFVFMHRATRARARGRAAHPLACGRPPRQRRSRDPCHRRQLSPPGRSVARGVERRRRLLRRHGLGDPRTQRKGRLRRGRRELGGAGRPAPCALCASRHPRRARCVTRGRDVALPHPGGPGHAEHRRAHQHHRRRRGRRRASAGTRAPRGHHRLRGDRRRRCALGADRSAPAHRLAATGHRARQPRVPLHRRGRTAATTAGRSSVRRSRSRPACPGCLLRGMFGMAP